MRRLVPAAALAVALLPSAVEAGVSCYADINAGKTITSSRVSDPWTGSVTIAADGLQGGVGAGCDYEMPGLMHGLVVGVLGRYDLQDISTKVMGDSISADGAWTAAMRAGVKVNPGTLAYGLLGMSWTEISFPGEKINPHGYVYGAGIEIDIGIPNLAGYVEWNHTTWGSATDAWDTKIRPESDTVRVGIKLKFGLDKVTP